MSLSINTVVIGGNLTRDVELKDVGTTKVGSFTVAVNKKFKGQDGQMKEKVSFIAITVWGEQAGLCAKFLRKGSQVIVEGELEQEIWEDKDSKKKREKTKVRANHVHFVGGNPNAGLEPHRSQSFADAIAAKAALTLPVDEKLPDEDWL